MSSRVFVSGIALCVLLISALEGGEATELCSAPESEISADLDPTTDTIEWTDGGQVVEIEVYVDVTHSFHGDLHLDLTSPDGTELRLKSDTKEDTDDVLLTFADNGEAYPPEDWNCDCRVQPFGDPGLSVFADEDADGDWTFTATDIFLGDDGTLNEWCFAITVCGEPPTDLECRPDGSGGVELTWAALTDGSGSIHIYEVDRESSERELVTTIDGTETSHLIESAAAGLHLYTVSGENAGCEVFGPSCEVSVGALEVCNAVDDELTLELLSESEVTVEPALLVADMAVSVDITHTFVGDLEIELTSPAGTTLRLKDDDDDDENEDMLITFTDEGSSYPPGIWDCACRVHPYGEDGLAVFDDETTDGDWTLVVDDVFFGDDGTLHEWCVRFYDDPITFLRGDANGDGTFSALGDALFLLNWGFVPESPEPPCHEAADMSGDGTLNALSDGLFGLNFGFIDGADPIPHPHPDCGGVDVLRIGCDVLPDCGISTDP